MSERPKHLANQLASPHSDLSYDTDDEATVMAPMDAAWVELSSAFYVNLKDAQAEDDTVMGRPFNPPKPQPLPTPATALAPLAPLVPKPKPQQPPPLSAPLEPEAKPPALQPVQTPSAPLPEQTVQPSSQTPLQTPEVLVAMPSLLSPAVPLEEPPKTASALRPRLLVLAITTSTLATAAILLWPTGKPQPPQVQPAKNEPAQVAPPTPPPQPPITSAPRAPHPVTNVPEKELARRRKLLERCQLKGSVEEILAQVGDVPETRLDLGGCAVKRGEVEEAIRHYNLALEMRPSEPWAYLGLARAHERGGDLVEALAQYQRYRGVAHKEMLPMVERKIAMLQKQIVN